MMEFTPAAGVMIVLSVLMFAATIWALVAARDYVLATRNGAKPGAALTWRTALPAVLIAALAVAMYLFAVALA